MTNLKVCNNAARRKNYLAHQCVLIAMTSLFLCSCNSFGSKNIKDTQKNSSVIPREVLFGNPERFNPKISPDGKKLAFCAPVDGVLNIWVKTIGQNDDETITHDRKRGITAYSWSPDSRQILYRQDSNGDENFHLYGVDLSTKDIRDFTPFPRTQAATLAINKRHPHTVLVRLNKDDPRLFDVYSLDLHSGALTLKAKNPGNFRTWLADKDLNVRAAIATLEEGKQSLMVRVDENSAWKTLLTFDFEDALADELYCGLLRFSKSGDHLFLKTSLGSNARRLIKVGITTGKIEEIARDDEYDLSHALFNNETGEPDVVAFLKDRLVYDVRNENFKNKFERMTAVSDGDLDSIQYNDDRTQYILGFAHDDKSYEYHHFDSVKNESTLLFQTRPKLNSFTLSSMKPISFVSRDGLTIHGYVTLPTQNNNLPLPLVVLVHGGPFTRDAWGYNAQVQWLASRGYAVLQINYRGSSGYGKKFLAAGNGEWGNRMHNDLIDGVQWAIEGKIADPKRVGIFGGSYGGYAALVGATFSPDVFACAVDYVGPSNLITLLNSFPAYWPIAPWEQRIGKRSDVEFLKSRSPLFKIDNIKIPIFIAHGANDVRVTLNESEQLVAALKKKNIPHEYLVFHDEGHGFARPENRNVFYERVEKFLADHLGGSFVAGGNDSLSPKSLLLNIKKGSQ